MLTVVLVSDHIDIANARIQFENGLCKCYRKQNIKEMRDAIFQKDHYISLDFVTGASEVYVFSRLMKIFANSISFGEIGVAKKIDL
jgi:hypothetical protein